MHPARLPFRPTSRRAAFTLVELLISMTITLIMVYALVEFMKYVGDTVTEGRGQIEMAGSIRSVRRQLYKDLQLATVYLKPSPDLDSGNGYLEIIEGFRSDANPNATLATNAFSPEVDLNNGTNPGKGPATGDSDDSVFFTARNTGDPYVGFFGGSTFTSELAEICWFTSHFVFDARATDPMNPSTPTNTFNPATNPLVISPECTLYRRVLLIRPDLNNYDSNNDFSYLSSVGTDPDLAYKALRDFWQKNDISARLVLRGGTYYLVANSLGDLSRRENRFAHLPTFPGYLDMSADQYWLLSVYWKQNKKIIPSPFILSGSRLGEDIMLSHVTAFDLRVYDPSAVVRSFTSPAASTTPNQSTVLTPGDPGFFVTNAQNEGTGAFVDLGYQRFNFPNGWTATPFYWPVRTVVNTTPGAATNSPNNTHDADTQLYCTYDTWSFSYEHDGINQDGDSVTVNMVTTPLVDEGTDGLDNDNQNGVDDPGERETSPPYPVVLQGLQVRIRVYDHSLRIGRQTTVVAEFTK